MNTDLRPLSLGEILDRTAQLYRSNFVLFVGIAVFPRAVLLVFQLLRILITHAFVGNSLPTNAITIVATCVSVLLSLAFVGVGLAAINRAVSAIYLGEPTSIALAYEQVKPHWFRYLSLMFVSVLYAWGPVVLSYVAIFAVIGVNGQKLGVAGGPPNIVGLMVVGLAGFALLFTFPYAVWMSLRYALAVPASIFENIGVIASLKRSVFLTRKGRGRIFVMVLLVGIVSWIILIAAEMPFLITGIKAGFKAARDHQAPQISLISQLASQLISFVVYSIIGPIYGIAITLFYYDERIRKEGFDIDWMMHRANLSGPEPPPIPLGPPQPVIE